MAFSADELHTRIVDDYCAAIAGGEDAVMITLHRADARELNARARRRLDAAGRLGRERLRIAGGEFAPGDLVVVKLNDRRLGIENGNRGRVVAVDVPGGALRVELSSDRTVTLPRGYLARTTERGEPTLVHGYAGTAHVAQGSTTDRAFVLGSDAAYREWGYVAWSRARLGTRFYVSEAPVDERDEHHSAAGEPRRAFDDVVRTMQQSRAQRAAVELVARDERGEVGGPGVTDADEALGERPRELLAQVAWRRARRVLEDARQELTQPASIGRNRRRHGRSL